MPRGGKAKFSVKPKNGQNWLELTGPSAPYSPRSEQQHSRTLLFFCFLGLPEIQYINLTIIMNSIRDKAKIKRLVLLCMFSLEQ